MNDMSDIKWTSMTDNAIMQTIGNFVQCHRLKQNITQTQLAEQSNLSRSTISLLENGEKITVPSLIQVLRVLNLLHVLENFQVKEEISPLAYLENQKQQRQRARNSTDKTAEDSEW